MAKADVVLKVEADSSEATKKLQKATLAAKQLKKALDELKDLEISITVTESSKKWWKFW